MVRSIFSQKSILALRTALALSILLMIFSALSCTQSSAPRPDTPVVGVILPYSSAFTAIANEQENAIKMALADSGQSADLVFVDCGGDNAGAVEAYKKVMSGAQKPHAIISCASWVAETLHPLAAEDDVFHIVIGSAAFERSVPRHTVRFTLDAHEEERQLAAYLKRFDRIAIFNMDNGYGNNWAEVIRRGFGDKIVTQVAYDPKSPSFEKLLQPVKAAGPDALVLLSAGNAARIAEEARRMGIDAQLIGTRPIERPELLETKATEGLVYTYPSSDKRHPMVAAYKAEYQSEPTIFAMEAYDSLRTLLLAMQVGGDSTEDLFTWYAGRTYTGALGEVVFDLQGDATYAYLYKEIANGEFRVAEFQYDMLLEDVRHEILSAFLDLSETMEEAAGDLSMSGLTGDLAQEHIDTAFKNARHAYDVVTVDLKGTIVAVAPTDFSEVVGADISGQEQIKRLHATKKPVLSLAIETVEGFTGYDIEHPVFDAEGRMIGSVSVLTEPDFFRNIIEPRMRNFPVEIWLMQKDGTIVYDINEEEIGRNTFTDPIYDDYPSLRKLGQRMVESKDGEGTYTFLDKKLGEKVRKSLVWTTVDLYGTEFRVALSHVIDAE